jgi:hypothetical protein
VDRKKEIELTYLDEARRASELFPPGEPDPCDPLDFLLPHGAGVLGIEVTQLCREAERREGARLGYIAPKARRIYSRRPGAVPVNVSPVLSDEAVQMHVDDLAAGLAEFVYNHRGANANLSWDRHDDMPQGFLSIGVFEPLQGQSEGDWRYFRAFDVVLASKDMIQARIAEKNARVAEYRKIASEVWLLIVNDQFLGPGEVCVRPDYVAEWSFKHNFDKALIFVRQPGGSGEVIELQRC